MSSEHTGSLLFGRADAPTRVLMLHGYTGSPDGLRSLGELVANKLDAQVFLPVLPGHGTCITSLEKLTYDDFKTAALHHAERFFHPSARSIVLGYSFGGFLAAEIVATRTIDACVVALTPYSLRFPFSLPYFELLSAWRSDWDKFLTSEERHIREGTFYYPRVPGSSLRDVKHAIARIETLRIPRLPVLCLHTDRDPLVDPESGALFLELFGKHTASRAVCLPDRRHALFYSPMHEEEDGLVLNFLSSVADIAY